MSAMPRSIPSSPSLPSSVPSARDPYAPSAHDKRRAEQLEAAWHAYHGRFRTGDPQWPLLWKVGKEPNPNVLINRCGPAADTDVAWLMGQSVGIELKKKPKAAQQYLDRVWGVSADDSSDDDKMALLQELATNGAVTGHAFLRIVWDAQTMDYPQLIVLDSAQVRVVCDPHNVKQVVSYIVEYQIPDVTSPNPDALATYRQVLELCDPTQPEQSPTTDSSYLGHPDATWRISEWQKAANSHVFALLAPPVVWPYPWAPIDGCPHLSRPNAYYGRPRLTPDVIHINEAICMVASNINKIGLRHGHPILYTKKQGSNQQALRHEPGTIMQVSDDIKAVEAHGDLDHLMQFEQDLRADFDEETHVPAQAFGRQADVPRTPVSGVAIRLGYGPLVADVMKERRTYGALIRRISQHLLELKNEGWADADVTLTWQDPLPADDLQQAQVAQVLVGLNVMSKRTAATQTGLDFDAEQEYIREEQQEALLAVTRGQGMPPMPGMPGMPGMNGMPQTPQPGQQAQPGQPGDDQQQQSPGNGGGTRGTRGSQATQTKQSTLATQATAALRKSR